MARTVHSGGECGEEQQAAKKQGVARGLQQQIEHGIGEKEHTAEDGRAPHAAEYRLQIAGNQAVAGKRRNQVGGSKADVFAEREQEQVKDADGRADQGVLHRMDAQAAQRFKEETAAKGDEQEENRVFAAACGQAVEVKAFVEGGYCLIAVGLGGDVLPGGVRVVFAVVHEAVKQL